MRRTDREISDVEKIKEILNRSTYLHLALSDGEYPYVLPLNFGYEFQGKTLALYIHGATEGKKWELLRKDPHVSFALECGVVPVSGGEIPCKYGARYASVMGRGMAAVVEDGAEKRHALEVLMKHQTGKDFAITEEMADTVTVMKVNVEAFTGKSRV